MTLNLMMHFFELLDLAHYFKNIQKHTYHPFIAIYKNKALPIILPCNHSSNHAADQSFHFLYIFLKEI